MKISFYVFGLILYCGNLFSQVGINTTTPNAQLDITSSNQATPGNTDGILIPKIDLFPVTNPTVAQNSMIVYLTTAASGKQPGFYYWEDVTTSWKGIGGFSGWDLLGNSATNPSVNFVGTTDDKDLVFKRNNIRAGRIEAVNTSLGVNSFNPLNSGISNTAIGDLTLSMNTSGNYNTAIGTSVLNANTIGTRNTAIGVNAMLFNVGGDFNTATGINALRNNTDGDYNTALGSYSLFTNNIGVQNTSTGSYAMYLNTIGNFNTANGVNAMKYNIDGNENTATGNNALQANTHGSYNTAVGESALYTSVSGINNTAVGAYTLANGLLTGINNTAIGGGALNVTQGSDNTGLGYHAGINITTGSNNIAVGSNALVQNPIISDQLSLANVVYGTTLSTTALGKIGIGEPAPNARLQISASNQAAPSNTDGIIIPKINAFPAVNPTIAQHGMMVFLVIGTALFPNGFYYWDFPSVSWIGLGPKPDADFFKSGTGNPPYLQTDDMYHSGNVALGLTTPTCKLDVTETAAGKATVLNISQFNPTITGSAGNNIITTNVNSGALASGFLTSNLNNMFNNNSVSGIGVLNNINGASSGFSMAVKNLLYTSGSGTKVGIYNDIQGGTGLVTGVSNNIFTSGLLPQTGVENNLNGTSDAPGKGVATIISGSGNGVKTGVDNSISNSGDGNQFGVSNNFSGSGAGDRNGLSSFFSGVGNGTIYGMQNTVFNSGNGLQYGTYNNFSGSGTGQHTGIYNVLSGTGDGQQYGDYNLITTTGVGNKYGSYNNITSTTGIGTHYGVYSSVLKSGSFAGYFLGNVAIGTTTLNNYIFPSSRGTNNQMMQTDAIGNVSWKDPNTALNNFAWTTTGNSGTTVASNFIGTTDNVDLSIKTFNTEAIRVTSAGKVGIGVNAPASELEVNGFTKLGSPAPAIKMLKLTGTTAAIQGNIANIAHGVTSSKILGVTVLVDYAAGNSVPPSYNASSGYEFDYYITTTNIVVWIKSGNSANILSKPLRILITYEQ